MRKSRENHISNREYIKKLVFSKTSEKSQEELIEASIYIEQLNNFIEDKIELSEDKVYQLLKYLYENHSLNLIYQLGKDKWLRRARKYEEKNTQVPKYCFTKTDELSVIPDDKKDIVGIGRLNKLKQPVYYGCFSDNNFNYYDVALSEVNAIDLDYINYLDSITTGYLQVISIGAFDLFMRGQALHHWIDSNNLRLFKLFKKCCEKKQNRFLLESHQLCSAFFADILSRKNHKNLYKATSILANIIFENKQVDAIIYESVQVKGAPVIAIKPKALAEKVQHKKIASLRVEANLGYGIYYVNVINEGIVHSDQLSWESTIND
ncbi:hypothetical protein B0F89_15010 [Malaciobacter marinus]|jgi:hypothetical protein|uniref:RES domain-containing protein n=1 Tax=Malaciobacter marinus TaxID=505249 RepID=A0AB36ZSD5_9BACT|nr:hypothetical protein [Malaciobacter marinus]PPK57336.1 hypothetical protein B0F89_15010 [Malaciobacter marinus]